MELTHRGAVRIVFLVPRQHFVPATRDSAASGKSQFRRTPVALEEGVNVSPIPGRLLSLEDSANGFAVRCTFACRLRRRSPLCHEHAEAQKRACWQQELIGFYHIETLPSFIDALNTTG